MEVYDDPLGSLRPLLVAHLRSPTVAYSRSQAFPISSLSVYTHGTFEANGASLGHLSKFGKRLSGVHRFSATDCSTASSFDVNCTFMSARIKAILISGMSRSMSPRVSEPASPQSALYIKLLKLGFAKLW